jgi:RimJ/RimL family protein N-acetyltransferase
MSINLIIATYAGKYNSEVKNNLLITNLKIINSIKTNLSRITIMKPKINPEHEEIAGYYDFSSINIDNIRNKIVICECENIGISYGQFFAGISRDMSFDYFIFLEDDYTVFIDYFEEELIKELDNIENDSLLCSFIYKNKLWDIINYSKKIGETIDNINILYNKLEQYNMHNIRCKIPDFSLCILSNKTLQKIIDRFTNFDNIFDIFNIKFTKIWLHQILFGYILYASNIKIYDISNSHLNIFYHTSEKKISTCNFENYVSNWTKKPYLNEKFKLPLFIPVQIIDNNIFSSDLLKMNKYILDENKFNKRLQYLINIGDFTLRNIEYDDFDKGYMDLMFEFTNYQYPITKENFINFIDTQKNYKTIVIYSDKEKRIIGAGTIIIVHKIHNNPIGQIEDVIISEKYRNNGFGKQIIEKLIDIGKNECKCYKIILNCLEKNIKFYENCGFINVGVEMKLL